MITCPKCGSTNTPVIDSRAPSTLDKRRRRRRCALCGHHFTTAERVEPRCAPTASHHATLKYVAGRLYKAKLLLNTRPEHAAQQINHALAKLSALFEARK